MSYENKKLTQILKKNTLTKSFLLEAKVYQSISPNHIPHFMVCYKTELINQIFRTAYVILITTFQSDGNCNFAIKSQSLNRCYRLASKSTSEYV